MRRAHTLLLLTLTACATPEGAIVEGGGAPPRPTEEELVARWGPPATWPVALSSADVMEGIKREVALVRQCTTEGRGLVVVHFTIRPDGTVEGARAKAGPEDLASCVLMRLEFFRFRPYTGPQMSPFDFPFKF